MSRIQFFLGEIETLIEDNHSQTHPFYRLSLDQREAVVDSLADLIVQDEHTNSLISDALWQVIDRHLDVAIENVKEEY